MNLILAICLIAGFSVGAGFLALTASVGLSGFWGGVISIVLIWLLGIASSFLYLEAFLSVPGARHIPSLCRKITGKTSAIINEVVYVIFNYTILVIGYIFLYNLFHIHLSDDHLYHPYMTHFWILIATIVMGLIVYLGHKVALGTIAIAFVLFLAAFAYGAYSIDFLSPPGIAIRPHFLFILFAISTIFNFSFYQTVLPTLVQFLQRDRKRLITAIWIGFTLAMLILLIWLWMTIRPEIYSRFLAAFETKSSYAKGILFLAESHFLKNSISFLGVFSVIISILSVGISLIDFYQDAFTGWFQRNPATFRFLAVCLIFFPSWGISVLVFNDFMIFSTLLTTFIEVLLAMVFPLQWVWNIRYQLNLARQPILPGGKKMIVFLCFATALLILIVGTTPIHLIDL